MEVVILFGWIRTCSGQHAVRPTFLFRNSGVTLPASATQTGNVAVRLVHQSLHSQEPLSVGACQEPHLPVQRFVASTSSTSPTTSSNHSRLKTLYSQIGSYLIAEDDFRSTTFEDITKVMKGQRQNKRIDMPPRAYPPTHLQLIPAHHPNAKPAKSPVQLGPPLWAARPRLTCKASNRGQVGL